MDLPVSPLRSWYHQRNQNEIQSLIEILRKKGIAAHALGDIDSVEFFFAIAEQLQ